MAKKHLTKLELSTVDKLLPELRTHLKLKKSGSMTLADLKRIHAWVWSIFEYKGDEYTFDKSDYWDINVFDRMVLAWSKGKKVPDDCDGFGYAVIEAIYRLLGVVKTRIKAVACGTETGEGHFVAWARLDNGEWYQTENRTVTPMPIKHFIDLGYDYWYVQPLDKIGQWHKVTDKDLKGVGALAAPEVTLDNYTAVGKSKMILQGWITKVAGIGTIVASQIPAWKDDLQAMLSPELVGGLMVASGVISIILRVKTIKPVDKKKGYDR
jgi:predicted transglutaminase-like cysteine proteinase